MQRFSPILVATCVAVLMVAGALTTLSLQAQETVKRYVVDPTDSSIKWHGSKVGTDHFGKIEVKSGWLTIQGERITGGEFVADMTSISNDDLTSASQQKKLVGHLLSDDFFHVKKFPESKLVLTKVVAKDKGDHELTGDLTIRGITRPVSFSAHVEVDDDHLHASGKLTFNRAAHDVKFNSGTLAKLGNKLIYDEVPLEIELLARLP